MQNKLLIALFFVISLIVLFFPVRLELFYAPVTSALIFQNFTLFAALYCFWFVLFFVLFFKRKNVVDQVILLCVFSIVFVGFWIIITPWGGYADSNYQLGLVNYLLAAGKITLQNQNLWYFQFPALQILGTTICSVTGASASS